MQRLELLLPAPAGQLAADEALLDWCEAGHGGETLAFWEPRETFVVVGYANQVAAEVNVAACAAKDIPIFRRCSGGGAVVQMPGGLNYSLLLRITEHGPTRNISAANQFIMERNCQAVQAALGPPPPAVSIRGHTDLAVATPGITQPNALEQNDARPHPGPLPRGEGETIPASLADSSSHVHRHNLQIVRGNPATFLKVAGNSQRRRRRFLLFHGTFLLNCDLRWISELLSMPSLQPDYRARRPHGEFVANLHLPAAAVKAALAQAWKVDGELNDPPLEEIAKLAREKYAPRQWNYKF